MILRDYQRDIFEQITLSCSNDIVQLDTGAGKTPIEAALAEWSPLTLLVAHRNILIQQISEKLAAFGLEHDTISTEHTRRRCIAAHRPHGRSFIRRGHATRRVASMQSIVSAVKRNRIDIDRSAPWLIVIDEAHHVIPDNMWGSLRTMFPDARIVGFTATPARMDGESLHVDKGGLFDRLVQASMLGNDSARALIERGYLSGFKAYAARTSYNIEDSMSEAERDARFERKLEADLAGEYFDNGERRAFRHVGRGGSLDWESGILELIGDPVEEYKRHAMGTRAILMAPAIKNAEAFARDFRAKGIPSACINSTQSPAEIARLLDAFRSGRVLVLTNVDMVGEGFDLPACETLIIATRTAAFPRYRQWCGRISRPDTGKSHGTIIDLTGMIAMHGMPDEPVEWDLLNPPCGPKTKRQVACEECGLFFEFKLEFCPECGAENHWLDNRGGAFAPGSFMFDIKMIDQAYRGFVLRERHQANNAERMRTELIKPYDGFGGGLVGRTLNELSAWFISSLQSSGVPVEDINAFSISNEVRSKDFWMNNFTRSDIGSSPKKAKKVFDKWRKSR